MNKGNITIRGVSQSDTDALISLCKVIGLFQPDELEQLSGMLSAYFENTSDGQHQWLIAEENNESIGVAYYVAETFADGVFNLLLIGVHPNRQREGRGTKLLRYIEQELEKKGGRILIVETSGLESFEATRTFYRQNGYDEEARIRDFYHSGEDKIIFRKALNI